MDVKKDNLPPASLDEVDQFLIAALREDGRVPFSQIAEKLQVSPGMIRVRYNRLVEHGVLKVVAISNPLRLGYKTMAMIGVRTDGARMLEVARAISALEEVVYLIVVSGRFDIMCEVVCRDNAELLRFLTEKLHPIEGVREAESFIHLKIEKEVYF